jgi:hypothetical protein
MRLTTPSCRLGGTTSARMKRWRSSGSTAGCVIGLPAFADAPALCRKRSRTPPSHCLPPTTLMEQRQNSPCHCFLNTLVVIQELERGIEDEGVADVMVMVDVLLDLLILVPADAVMIQCHQDKVLLRRPLNIQSGFVSIGLSRPIKWR